MKKTIKYNYETEREIISNLLSSFDSRSERVINLLQPKHFLSDKHRKFFGIIKKLGSQINYLAVNGEMLKQNINTDELSEYLESDFTITIEQLYNLLISNYMTFRIAEIKENDDDIFGKIKELEKEIKFINFDEPESCVKYLLDAYDEEELKRGYNCGFKKIDENTNGLKGGHYWVLGGYSNTGKSFFALQLTDNALQQKAKVLFISTEMREQDLMARLVKINQNKGMNHDQAFQKVCEYEKNFEVTSKIYRIEDIQTKIESGRYEIVIIDFMQNIITNDSKEYERLSNVSQTLRRLAIANNVCILALSQVSEEFQKSGKFATMGFKGSGGIGADSDVGIIIYRDFDNEEEDPDNQIVPFYVIFRKNRFGRTGKFELSFDRRIAKIF